MHVFVHAKGQTKARPIGTVSDGASLIAFDYETSGVTSPYRADGEAAQPIREIREIRGLYKVIPLIY